MVPKRQYYNPYNAYLNGRSYKNVSEFHVLVMLPGRHVLPNFDATRFIFVGFFEISKVLRNNPQALIELK